MHEQKEEKEENKVVISNKVAIIMLTNNTKSLKMTWNEMGIFEWKKVSQLLKKGSLSVCVGE